MIGNGFAPQGLADRACRRAIAAARGDLAVGESVSGAPIARVTSYTRR